MKLVCFSGWKRSGKDTASNIFIERYNATRLAFADSLKEMVSADNPGITRELIDSPKTKEAPLLHMPVMVKDKFTENLNMFMKNEFRDQEGLMPQGRVLVENGMLVDERIMTNGAPAREFHQLYWTPRALCIHKGSTMRAIDPDYWVNRALTNLENGKVYVISDLRFKSEMESIRKTIPDVVFVRVNRFDKSDSTDPSERDLDDAEFNYVIQNTGTLESFQDTVVALANKVLG